MINITPLCEAIITLAILVITTFLAPYLKNKMGDQKYNKMKDWIKIGVQAAEMIFTESGLGQKKKEYVLKFLEQKGYTIDESIDNLVESAVLELKKD